MGGTLQNPNLVKDTYQHLLFTKDDNKLYDTNISSNEDREITTLANISNILCDLTVGGDLTVVGNNLKFGNNEEINNETNGTLEFKAGKMDFRVPTSGDDVTFRMLQASDTVPRFAFGWDDASAGLLFNFFSEELNLATAEYIFSSGGSLSMDGACTIKGNQIKGSTGGVDITLSTVGGHGGGSLAGNVKIMNDLFVGNGNIWLNDVAEGKLYIKDNQSYGFTIATENHDGTDIHSTGTLTHRPIVFSTTTDIQKIKLNFPRAGLTVTNEALYLEGDCPADAEIDASRLAGIRMQPRFHNDQITPSAFKVLGHEYITMEDAILVDDFAGGPYITMNKAIAFSFPFTNGLTLVHKAIHHSPGFTVSTPPDVEYMIRVKVGNNPDDLYYIPLYQ